MGLFMFPNLQGRNLFLRIIGSPSDIPISVDVLYLKYPINWCIRTYEEHRERKCQVLEKTAQ